MAEFDLLRSVICSLDHFHGADNSQARPPYAAALLK